MADEDDSIQRDNDEENNDSQNDEIQEPEKNDSGNDGDNDSNSTADSIAATEARFTRLESTLERVLGEISAIREAQGILVENGAVITETDADFDMVEEDSFIPPTELDLLI